MLEKIHIVAVLAVISTGVLFWIWRRPAPRDTTSELSELVDQLRVDESNYRSPVHNTSIKRFAKVDADDYQRYYKTVLDSAVLHLKIVGQEKEITKIYTLCSKSLRKRWSTIFHAENEKDHATESTFWTYSIFCSVLLRHIIRTLNQYQFAYQESELSPLLYNLTDLNKAEIKKRDEQATNMYPANTANIHIIDKVLPPHVVELLIAKQAYPYLVNAVTGYYQNKQHPYYSIIEQVETHVLEVAPPSWFDDVLNQVLKLIENNTVSKNKMNSKVFESVYSLLIDRHLLWEMFKVYQVSESPVLEKGEFEKKVKESLGLMGDADNYNYEIKVSTDNEERITFIVTNMIALPYSKINYSYSQRLAAKKIPIGREIVPVSDFDEEENSVESEPEVNSTQAEWPKNVTEQSTDDNALLSELFKKEKRVTNIE